jgi:NlpC/P60 family putative phage cell wall peptidase
MTERHQIIAEARAWLKTPFHHQASVKGVGCDCGGLVRGVADALGINTDGVPSNYAREPANGMLQQILNKYLYETNDPRPGDVVLFRLLKEPQHLGILTAKDYVIHAYQPTGYVTEHRLDDKWSRRIVAYYRFPGVTD